MTNAEYNELLQRLTSDLLTASRDVNVLTEANSLDNVDSFPAINTNTNTLVKVPLSLLTEALAAAVGEAQSAVGSARAAASGWAVAQRKMLTQQGTIETHIEGLQNGIDTITSVYNVTNNHGGTYNIGTALAVVPNATRRVGLIITYLTSEGTWETKQYVGIDVSGWNTVDNWVDFGGGGADFVEVTSDEVAAMEDPV